VKSLLALMLGLAMTATTTAAFAQSRDDFKNGGNTIRLLGGSTQASSVFGLDYERRTGSMGLGAKILQSTKNEDAGKFESTTFDIHATSHLYDQNDMDIYVAAGVAVTNMDDVADVNDPTSEPSDETLVGPTLAIGAMYTLNPRWSVGFEYYTLYNWFSDKVADDFSFANVALGFNF